MDPGRTKIDFGTPVPKQIESMLEVCFALKSGSTTSCNATPPEIKEHCRHDSMVLQQKSTETDKTQP